MGCLWFSLILVLLASGDDMARSIGVVLFVLWWLFEGCNKD